MPSLGDLLLGLPQANLLNSFTIQHEILLQMLQSTAVCINELFFKLVVFYLFVCFSPDFIDYVSSIHIYPIFLILKPIKLFIIGIL